METVKVLTEDQWEKEYSPIVENNEELTMNTWAEAWDKVTELCLNKGDSRLNYRYIWSMGDADDGGIFISNGYHKVNVYAYKITGKPWGEDEHKKNKNVFIEVEIPPFDE